MIKVIKEAEVRRKFEEEEKKNNEKKRTNDRISQEKKYSIETIENLMSKKGLSTSNLGKYSNYQKQISDLDIIQEIRKLRDKIMEFIHDN